MAGDPRAWTLAGLTIAVASSAGCIAPDVEVIGALGVTVDEQQRVVLVVEACDGAATRVDLVLQREGLADDEENEPVATWSAQVPAPGTSTLVPGAPADPWSGPPVELVAGRDYVATAVGEGEREVLGQVAFRGADLAGMEAGTVYANEPDPDETELVGSRAADFTDEVCSR